jgi:hypothetical protein
MDSKDHEEEGWKEETILYAQHPPYFPSFGNSWYNDLKKYLQHGTAPNHLNFKQRRSLILKSTQYQLVQGIIFRRKKNYDEVLL